MDIETEFRIITSELYDHTTYTIITWENIKKGDLTSEFDWSIYRLDVKTKTYWEIRNRVMHGYIWDKIAEYLKCDTTALDKPYQLGSLDAFNNPYRLIPE